MHDRKIAKSENLVLLSRINTTIFINQYSLTSLIESKDVLLLHYVKDYQGGKPSDPREIAWIFFTHSNQKNLPVWKR